MPSLVGTWQAQWKAAGRTVLKNEVNNSSEHLCPCSSFISAPTPLPPPFLLISFISPRSFFYPPPTHPSRRAFYFLSWVFLDLSIDDDCSLLPLLFFSWTFPQSLLVYSLILFLKGLIFSWHFTSHPLNTWKQRLPVYNELMSLVC